MEHSLAVVAAMVSISGPRISQHTIEEALRAAGLGNVEVTWRSTEGGADDKDWHITVATGQKVAVGALPSSRQSAQDLAAFLIGLLRG
jgi:hypothetical protein